MKALRRLLVPVGLGALGVGLALLIVLLTLKAFGRDDLLDRFLSRCVQAEGDWYELVEPLVYSYPTPCSSFYWDIYPTGEFYNLISLNNYGLHDTNVTLEKPPGTFRILVMGDSFPQGWQVKLQEGFPWLMEQALNQNGAQRVEIVNLAIDTYGTDRELLLYAALGWRFQPDLVLLAFYTGNDLKDNSYSLSALAAGGTIVRATFTLDESGALQLHNAPELDVNRFPESPAWVWLAEQTQRQTPMPDLPL
ncbi:MAG: SGNH/GDSL hydrolase family protein, partial [Anaerolineae bacterium]|nr:SGNH/GDSL hydrolase family protein [Anaerolineae bacterium]